MKVLVAGDFSSPAFSLTIESPSVTLFNGLVDTFKTQAQVTAMLGVSVLDAIWSTAKNKPDGARAPTTMKSLWEHIMNGVYVNVCMIDIMKDARFMNDVFNKLTAAFPPDLANDQNSLLKAMMLMLGAVGVGTGLHLDWKNAINMAVLIGPSANNLPVALWMFIRPTREAVAAVHEYLKANLHEKHPNGLELWREAG